ncbi:hypothetical protein [Bartonella quintana]|uniref:hypothetical protein n=1 Tax=Bartonella quintana TaxID=803 RepID=UPI001ABA5D25|nr:hypothetical protein [Bartonella quintana]
MAIPLTMVGTYLRALPQTITTAEEDNTVSTYSIDDEMSINNLDMKILDWLQKFITYFAKKAAKQIHTPRQLQCCNHT